MDILNMLAELRTERQAVEEAILVLERLSRGQGKRRGRPPKWMSNSRNYQTDETAAPRKKRIVSAEARARMAAAQRKRWAAAKGQQP